MTYIEFFDKNSAENICACITAPPQRVILIGDNRKLLKSQADRYSENMQKILVATAPDVSGGADILRERAKDMQIGIVENVQKSDDAELQKTIKSFWNS